MVPTDRYVGLSFGSCFKSTDFNIHIEDVYETMGEDLNTAWKCFAVKGFLLFHRWDDVWWFYYFVKSYHLELCTELFMGETNSIYGFCSK